MPVSVALKVTVLGFALVELMATWAPDGLTIATVSTAEGVVQEMVALIVPLSETGMLLLYGAPPTETVPERLVVAPRALVTHRLAASTARPTTTTRLPTTGIRPFICPPPLLWNHGQLYPLFPEPSNLDPIAWTSYAATRAKSRRSGPPPRT